MALIGLFSLLVGLTMPPMFVGGYIVGVLTVGLAMVVAT